ncbi:MAG: ABC transporter permease [Deltaproteobacteria bacterium]|nr:ABC transporter permease [Deltaproteobacteria bacterium]
MGRQSRLVLAAALAGYAFLYLPLVLVVAFSFNDSRLNAEWVGFTWRWYRVLLADGNMLRAAYNSLVIAAVSTLAATVLGTLAGFALHRYRPRLLGFLVVTPLAVPDILSGVSLLLLFVLLNVTLGLTSVVLAHISFSLSYVALVVRASLAGLDPALVEAARDLGATPFQAFRRITAPLIAPGILAGAFLAFSLSLDDFVITFFTAGAGINTLPLQIYSMLKVAVTPEVNVVSTLLMAVTLVLVIAASRLAPQALRLR